jgi:hypothetical protein
VSHPSEWLVELGIIHLEPASAELLSRYDASMVERGLAPERQDFARDYVELGAVDFALGGRMIASAQDEKLAASALPVTITPSHLGLSLFKTNCGPFGEHGRKAPEELQPWDVFAFAGDMSKAELLGVRGVNELATVEGMQDFIARLARRYGDAGLSKAVVDSGLLAAQGVVWFAKLALLRGEDPAQAQNLRFAEYA